jgi:haloacetate dehalogenase
LAQPSPLPETLIGGDPEFYVRYCIERWAAPGFSFDETDVADYVACMRDPMAIHGACEDYRSGWARDRADDAEDRAIGRKIECPTLVLWGELSAFARSDPLKVWRRWCTDLRGSSVPGGHFVPEESPDEMVAAFLEFFG